MAGSNASNKPTTASLLSSYNANKPVMGRPTAVTKEVLRKLEEAFAIGASDKEACFYAGITPSTLYLHQEKHPDFTERKNALKERPVLMARQSVVKAIESDLLTARWFLERKRKSEFAVKTETDITTGGEQIQPATLPDELVAGFSDWLSKSTKQ